MQERRLPSCSRDHPTEDSEHGPATGACCSCDADFAICVSSNIGSMNVDYIGMTPAHHASEEGEETMLNSSSSSHDADLQRHHHHHHHHHHEMAGIFSECPHTYACARCVSCLDDYPALLCAQTACPAICRKCHPRFMSIEEENFLRTSSMESDSDDGEGRNATTDSDDTDATSDEMSGVRYSRFHDATSSINGIEYLQWLRSKLNMPPLDDVREEIEAYQDNVIAEVFVSEDEDVSISPSMTESDAVSVSEGALQDLSDGDTIDMEEDGHPAFLDSLHTLADAMTTSSTQTDTEDDAATGDGGGGGSMMVASFAGKMIDSSDAASISFDDDPSLQTMDTKAQNDGRNESATDESEAAHHHHHKQHHRHHRRHSHRHENDESSTADVSVATTVSEPKMATPDAVTAPGAVSTLEEVNEVAGSDANSTTETTTHAQQQHHHPHHHHRYQWLIIPSTMFAAFLAIVAGIIMRRHFIHRRRRQFHVSQDIRPKRAVAKRTNRNAGGGDTLYVFEDDEDDTNTGETSGQRNRNRPGSSASNLSHTSDTNERWIATTKNPLFDSPSGV